VLRAVQLLQAAEEVRLTSPPADPPPAASSSVVVPMPPAMAAPRAPAAPAVQPVPLVAQLFQPPAGQARQQQPIAQAQQPAPAPAPAQPVQPGQQVVPAPPGGLPPGLTAGLVGPVQIEFIEGPDVLVITGNQQDVERVAAIIEEIERLTLPPFIHVQPLEHANSEAVATLITQLYEQTLAPRLGRVSITALAKPNAVLLIGKEESVQAVIDLVKKLDMPVVPTTQFAVYPLKYASAAAAQTTITTFFANRTGLGPRVVVTADFRTNSLIVQAAPRDLAEVAELIHQIDTIQSVAKDVLRVFPLRNSLADELAPVLQEAINAQGGGTTAPGVSPLQPGAGGAPQRPGAAGGGAGRSSTLQFMTIDAEGRRQLATSGILTDVRITADPRANALIVVGPPESMDLVEALINQLDEIPAAESQIKVFNVVNGDATLMMQMLQGLFGQQQQAGGGVGGLFGAGAGAQGFLGENPLVSMRFAVDQRTNSIIASGSAKDLLVVEAILLRLDMEDLQQRKSIVYRLKNAPALNVAQTINDFLQSERQVQAIAPEQLSPFQQIEREVVVVPEIVSNSLIVSATPRYFEEIRRIVEELDARPPMVMIQVLIGEVTLNNTDEFGVELGLQDSLLFNRSLLGDLVTTTTSTQVPQGNTVVTTTDQVIQAATLNPGFNFNNQPLGNSGSDASLATKDKVAGQALTNFSLGRINSELGFGGLVLAASSDAVSILIRALKECRRLEVLSRPQVMTMDNQSAFVQVGQRVPRIQGVTLGQFGQTNNVVDVNVGIILGVTPRISPDGIVVMEIDAERSALGPEAEGVPISTSVTGEVVRQPLINTTTAQTTVSAADGQTVVLGGLLTKETAKARRRVPLLSSIPVLGNLFRYDADATRRTELLIILTPRIVRNEAEADAVKQAEAARMSWCLADVRKMHGDPGIYSRDAEWYDQTMVIHPDQTPLGVETVPGPSRSILPPGAVPPGAVPPGAVPPGAMQGPTLSVPPQSQPLPPQPVPALPPPPPGPPANVVPPGAEQPQAATPSLSPQVQGPSLQPMPSNPDHARYGPPPPTANGPVREVYYQQPVATPQR
jgi:type II secretion system protein D